MAVRTLSDPEEAADALQDAMLSAFRRADSYRGDAAVTTWLHRIVVNACLDRIRRRAARPVIASDERALETLASPDAGPDPAAAADLSLDVRAALATIPLEQRIALIYIDMLGYPVADAAVVLGVSEGTIKSRCARGRARLLPRLAHLRAAAPRVPGPRLESRGRGGADAGDGMGADQASGGAGGPITDPLAPERNRPAAGSVLPAGEGGGEAL